MCHMNQIPLSLIAPIRLTGEAPSGIYYPFKPFGVTMLATVWDGKPHIMYLNGEKPFACFPLQVGYSARGSIIRNVEFHVDLSSQYDAVQESDPLGALIIQDARAFVMAFRPGGFEDPFEFPLWGEFESWSKEEKLGFSRWSISVRDGQDRIVLWSSKED
jgi:hypothetical protein